MTLTQLSYAVALADHGHFGRAAEACFVSQPTLSTQLQKLEAELGVPLFDRSVTPVQVTGLGAPLLAQARVVLAERDRLYAMLHDDGPPAGSVRVGIIPTLASYVVPLLAPALAERHPAIELTVEEATTAHLLDRLGAGTLDAGLVATDEPRPRLEALPLFREPFVAYVADGHPLARRSSLDAEAVSDADPWLLAEGHCLRDQVMQLCRRPAPRRAGPMRFESGNLETLRHLVDRVGGVTLLPFLATRYLAPEARARVRPFAAPIPYREVRLVRPRASARQRLTDALAEVLRDAVTPLLAP